MDSLLDKTSPKAIKTALKALPRGSDALDLAYDEAMERIHSQRPGLKTLAERVLSFITYAVRPLRVSELQHALAVEIGEPALDEENITDIQELVSVCAGLVSIDQTNSLQLVHYTTQEYFKRFCERYLPDAQEKIALTCLTYISFDVFEAGPCISDIEFKIRQLEYPFYSYASKNWSDHVHQDTGRTCMNLALNLLLNGSLVLSSYEASLNRFTRIIGRSKGISWSVTGLHLAASQGLDDIVLRLMELGASPNAKDWYGKTPLAEAAWKGHYSTVALLMTHKDIDLNISDCKMNHPLHAAALSGSVAAVKMLSSFQNVDVNLRNVDGWSPLLIAAKYDSIEVVEFLLTCKNIDVNQQGFGGHTALSVAIHYRGSVKIMNMLLAKGATLVYTSPTKATILHLIARKGRSEILRILLNSRKDSILQMSNMLDNRGFTPATIAAQNGHTDVLNILLSIGALNAQQTCLHFTAGQGDIATVQSILDFGVDPRQQDIHGWTALTFARAYGQEAMYRHLLLSCTGLSDDCNGVPPSHYNDGFDPSLPLVDDDGLVMGTSHIQKRIPYGALEPLRAFVKDGKDQYHQWRGNHPVPIDIHDCYFEIRVEDQGDERQVSTSVWVSRLFLLRACN